MAWDIEVVDECAVVRMNTNKVNVQNDRFFADLHGAFDHLEREFSELPVVLTGQGGVFSAGIDFQYSFEVFGGGSHEKNPSVVSGVPRNEPAHLQVPEADRGGRERPRHRRRADHGARL
jgi:enoyl-CoA hydratase/carnithine racemase